MSKLFKEAGYVTSDNEDAVKSFEILNHIIMKTAVDIAIKQYLELEKRSKNDAECGSQGT